MSKQIITISREFGSGGRSVGHRVAGLLNVPYYDKELVKQVAVETGFDEKFIEQEGEYASPWQSLLSYAFAGGGGVRQHMNGLSTADFLWVIQCRVILDLAEKGPCVIVGRCADYILQGREDCFHVFITGALPDRANRVIAEHGVAVDAARSHVKERDRKRSSYYKHITDQVWGMAANYDLCLNSSKLGIDRCVELILASVDMGTDHV